ncbi:MAG: type II toxin-antitoxin system RelE/ParE family toxin [Syntrophales bacterium]|nr:type II toxin-antitoxin system RelE/ParE family toxin [Syntrophales bacterium]MDD5643767.1 type II toxin-antitoxin system RelE/ParE family toxin [Syntrophales bacterium]
MPKVVKRPLAETDLEEIWWYIAQDNPDAADRVLDKIEERCRTLAQFPNMGFSRDELHPGLRSLPVGKYLIFYLPIADGIEVVRVLPGMMDIDAFF